MLTNMEAIVRCIDDVGIIGDAQSVSLCNNQVDEVVNRGQGLQTSAVKLVIVIDYRLIPLRKVFEVRWSICLSRVSVCSEINKDYLLYQD